MKKIIPFIIYIIFISSFTSAKNGDIDNIHENEKTEPGIKHVGVEIADEPAIIIEGRTITLSEAIKKAIERNPDIYAAKYSAAMANTGEMRFNAKYSPLIKAEGGISSVTNPELLYTLYGKKNDSTTGSVSIAKMFSSGTTVAAGISHTNSKFDPGLLPRTYDITSPVVFAMIEQELLRNSFGYSDRRQEQILKNTTRSQKEAMLYSISMIALGVIIDYWDVVICQDQLDNAKLILNETKKVRGIVAEKVKIGLSEKFEINYWNSLVAGSKATVTQSEQNYRNAVRKLFRDINYEGDIRVQSQVILTDRLPGINHEDALKTAFLKRADYNNALRDLDNLKLTLQIYENDALPSLKGSVSASSMDYNYESSGNAYSNVSNMKYHSYEAKVSMTYPLDNTDQKASERNARWMIEVAKEQLEKMRKAVRDDVITKIENVSTCYELYRNAKEARIEAEIYYNKIVTNLRYGRFAASSVRDALDALANCRNRELQLLVVYNASLLEFEVSKNNLFERYGINAENYIPKEK